MLNVQSHQVKLLQQRLEDSLCSCCGKLIKTRKHLANEAWCSSTALCEHKCVFEFNINVCKHFLIKMEIIYFQMFLVKIIRFSFFVDHTLLETAVKLSMHMTALPMSKPDIHHVNVGLKHCRLLWQKVQNTLCSQIRGIAMISRTVTQLIRKDEEVLGNISVNSPIKLMLEAACKWGEVLTKRDAKSEKCWVPVKCGYKLPKILLKVNEDTANSEKQH